MDQANNPQTQITEILNQGMGINLHWFPASVSISTLATILVGMANTEGGTVLIGISPRLGHIQGIDDPREVIDSVFKAALLADPPLVLPIPRLEALGGKSIVKIVVPKGLPSVYNLDGRFLRRIGSQTQPLAPQELRHLLMERGVIRFETQVPPYATLDDFDSHQVSRYLAAVQIQEEESWENVLYRRGCLKLDKGALRPTYAGLLLFGKNPRQFLPSVSI